MGLVRVVACGHVSVHMSIVVSTDYFTAPLLTDGGSLFFVRFFFQSSLAYGGIF